MAPPRASGAGPLALVHLAVPDVGFVADVLKPLALRESPLVPVPPVLPDGSEDEIRHRFAVVDPVVADDKAEVVRYTTPLGRPVPEPGDPKQDVAAVPGADPLVSLLVVSRTEVIRAAELPLARVAHRLSLRPVNQIG